MAGDLDVCNVCSDNFIVNSKFIKCECCENKFYLLCVAVKDSWQKTSTEHPNIFWFCDDCKEKLQVKMAPPKNGSENILLKKENECLLREQVLLKKLLDEMEYSNNLQKTVIKTKEEQIHKMQSADKEHSKGIPNAIQKIIIIPLPLRNQPGNRLASWVRRPPTQISKKQQFPKSPVSPIVGTQN